MSYYTYELIGPYAIQITQIKNLEDACDVVYSSEELQETLGIEGYIHAGMILRKSLIAEQLTILKQEMITKNKRSMKIEDADLVEVLTRNGSAASDFVKGLRRVGNRLSLHDNSGAEEKKKNRALFSKLCWRTIQRFNSKNRIEVDLKYVERDPHAALKFVKSLMSFEDVVAMLEEDLNDRYYPVTQSDIDTIKEMWENLDGFFEKKVEEVPKENEQPA